MAVPRLPLLSVFALTLVLVVGFAILYWMPDEKIEADLRLEFRIQKLAGDILHLDEVLTMSARMAAATGDIGWEERYRRYEPKLDEAIREAMDLARSAFMGEASAVTLAANEALVEMENEVFTLVRAGDLEAANSVISSETYEEQKGIYANGLTEIVAALHEEVDENLETHQRRDLLVFGLFTLTLVLAVIFWVSLLFHRPSK